LSKFGHKTRFYANEEINIQTNYAHFHPVYPTDICVKNQSKTPHRLRARGDNNNKKKKKKKMKKKKKRKNKKKKDPE
jgi:hypothetical protein